MQMSRCLKYIVPVVGVLRNLIDVIADSTVFCNVIKTACVFFSTKDKSKFFVKSFPAFLCSWQISYIYSHFKYGPVWL